MSNPFWEQQQQLVKMWSENMSKLPGMEAFKDMPNMADMTESWKKFTDMMPNMETYWNNMSKLVPNMESYWKTFTDNLPGAGAFSSMWPYKIPGMEIYEKLFEFWKDMGDPAAFMQNYQEKYIDLMNSIFKGLLPEGSAQFFEKPQELLQTCVAFYKDIFSPWMKIDEDIMRRIALGDMSAYAAFLKEFDEKYEESFAKLFNMMGMGANRESNEEIMHAMNSYIKVMISSGEMIALVMESFKNGMTSMMERYQAGLTEGKTVTTFREFYDLWFNTTEESLISLFNTDEFAKVFGEFADKYAKYMIAMNKVSERMLSSLPIPTDKDMKDLYRTVYDLRKEVRDLRRELSDMKSHSAEK